MEKQYEKKPSSVAAAESADTFSQLESRQPPVFQLKKGKEEGEELEDESIQLKKSKFDLPSDPPDSNASVVGNAQANKGHEKEPFQLKPNDTGLPDQLKSGVENLSGFSLDDVNVHYNSSKPAQLQAHAYAQGTDIHLGPGQEKHLPHEAWHVVQQKQGRVKPSRQMKGKVNVNDDEGLETEADVMGAKALQNAGLSSPGKALSTSSKLEDVFQMKLEKGKLNIVGEHHSTSDKIRDVEREFTAAKEYGGYWQEGDFKPDDENEEKFGDEPHFRALQGAIAFVSVCDTLIADFDSDNRLAKVKKLGHLLNQMCLNIDNYKYKDRLEINLTSLKTLATKFSDDATAGRITQAHVIQIRKYLQDTVMPALHPHINTKEGTAAIRSIYMLINAEGSTKEGIWKVGEAHLPDIELFETKENVTVTHETEFHEYLVDYMIEQLQ